MGLTKSIDLGICGDAGMASKSLLERLCSNGDAAAVACRENAKERLEKVCRAKREWEEELTEMSTGDIKVCAKKFIHSFLLCMPYISYIRPYRRPDTHSAF